MAHPVLDTIKLIEDRIAELLESGDLDDEDSCGYPTEKTLRAIGQHRFLMNLSTNLQAFYEGVF